MSFYGYVHWRMTTEISVMYGSEKVKYVTQVYCVTKSQIQKAAASLNCIVHFGTRHRHTVWSRPTSIICVSNLHMRLNLITEMSCFIIFKSYLNLRYPVYDVFYLSWHWNHSQCYQKPPNEWIFKIFLGGNPQNPLMRRGRYATSHVRRYPAIYYYRITFWNPPPFTPILDTPLIPASN